MCAVNGDISPIFYYGGRPMACGTKKAPAKAMNTAKKPAAKKR
jgi:hypothetical protein